MNRTYLEVMCAPLLNESFDLFSTFSVYNLPANMHFLGEDIFIHVLSIGGVTRLNICKMLVNERGVLQPTPEIISLSLTMWKELYQFLPNLITNEGNLFVIENKLCIFKRTLMDNRVIFTFQRMEERNDFTFSFIPGNVVLESSHIEKMLEYSGSISRSIKNSLIQKTLSYYLQEEIPFYVETLSEINVKDIKETLSNTLSTVIGEKIVEELKYAQHVDEEKIKDLFETVLFTFEWKQVAKSLLQENITLQNFEGLIALKSLLRYCNEEELYMQIKKMYFILNDQ